MEIPESKGHPLDAFADEVFKKRAFKRIYTQRASQTVFACESVIFTFLNGVSD